MSGKFKRVAFPTVVIFVLIGVVLLLSAGQLSRSLGPRPVINEVCNNNFSCLNDGYGNYPEWVELYNPTVFPIELKHFSMTASLEKKAWQLPDTILEPGAYILFGRHIDSRSRQKALQNREEAGLEAVILNDGADYSTEQNFFDFSISGSGDVVYLLNAAGDVADKCSVPETKYDTSYAREVDGTGEWRQQKPTPGYSNVGAKSVPRKLYKMPVFSEPSGFYEKEFSLTIDSEEGQDIYYTLDGSVPDRSGTKYEGPIKIEDHSGTLSEYASRDDLSAYTKFNVGRGLYKMKDKAVDKAVIVRAAVIDNEGNTGEIANGVYFIGYDKKSGYDGTPVLSIIAAPDDLFGYEKGIYVLGEEFDKFIDSGEVWEIVEKVEANYKDRGPNSEREAYVTFFDEEHRAAVSQAAGIRIRGGYSRHYSQKSINIFARDIYTEEGSFNFFGGVVPETSVSIFSGGQDTRYKFRDELFMRLMAGRDVAVLRSRPCYLFLNNEFWGTYWLQERYENYYFRENYNTGANQTAAIKLDYHTDDEELLDEKYLKILDFIEGGQLKDEETYADFCELVDIDSLMDYYAANIYIEHLGDWPRTNIGIWRTLSIEPDNRYEDGRWRYFVFDVNSSSMNNPEEETLREVLGFDALLRELFKNEHFRLAFLERFKELENSVFSMDRVDAVLEELDKEMGSRLEKSWNRFYQSKWSEKNALDKYTADLRSFFEKRGAYIDEVMEEACLNYDEYMSRESDGENDEDEDYDDEVED